MNYVGNLPQMGVLNLALTPENEHLFENSPARSVHAALVRRLELLDPELSDALHNHNKEYPASYHPWTISPLMGRLRCEGRWLTAFPGVSYEVRITALAPRVLETLTDAFDLDSPLGREPLVLDGAPFYVVPEESYWERPNAYASILTAARPTRRITLKFLSPTAFRSQGQIRLDALPKLCVLGYLRKWNAFGDVMLPEKPLLKYLEDHVGAVEERLSPKQVRFGPDRYISGVIGEVVWEADGESPSMLRLVNALAEFASYCGTGVSTAQGMGQTVRLSTGFHGKPS